MTQKFFSSLRIDWQSPQTHILIGLMAPTVVAGMSNHMFNVALPTIRGDFAIDADVAAWVVMSYTLPFMTLMPLYGRLGDGLGKRRMLIFGTVLFLVGTAITTGATSLAWLMGGRFVQGMGTAGFVPLCLAIISQRFDATERGKIMGIWNSAIPLTGLTVPYVSGLLVDFGGWRAIYPPMFLAALLAVMMIWRNIEPLTGRADFQMLRRFDWTGVALLSGALAALLFYTSSRPITGVPALSDWRLLAVCLALFGGLVVWERRRINPYVSLGILADRAFTLTSICAGLRMFLMSSISFLMPLYLKDVHAASASAIGLVLAAQAGMLFVMSRPGGQLADRWGSRRRYS